MRWEDVGEEFDGDRPAGARATPTLEAFASPMAPMEIGQVAGLEANPVTNAKALLRYGLPINNKPIQGGAKEARKHQRRLARSRVNFRGVESNVNGSLKIVQKDGAKIIASSRRARRRTVRRLSRSSKPCWRISKSSSAKGQARGAAAAARGALARRTHRGGHGRWLPVRCAEAVRGQTPSQGPGDGGHVGEDQDNANTDGGVLTIVLDGYNAPVTAGQFADLINLGFYNKMPIQRSDGFVVQSASRLMARQGEREERTVPLEIMVQGDKVPEYEFTLEDLGRYRDQPVLPFNAFGTLAMARHEANQSGSSQFFFLFASPSSRRPVPTFWTVVTPSLDTWSRTKSSFAISRLTTRSSP